ncbi:MAG TPA: GNAT family N-acetyltransferase [Thermomicrobiales bacterium]|jgi:predicted GNAT family acetyltransferase
MNINPDNLVVKNNEAEHRYEIAIEGQLAVLTYRLVGARITLIHTGVPAALEGHGIAGKLAQYALDDARARELAVIPRCPFVVRYIQRHRGYADLVIPQERAQYLAPQAER